jgi:hypothetical protein
MKKIAIDPNKISKICNVVIPSTYSVYLESSTRAFLWTKLDGNALNLSKDQKHDFQRLLATTI